MATRVRLQIARQPDHAACGPTCLHAIYRYYGDSISLARVVREVRRLRNGGTLAVCLGNHALSRGYRVRIHTYDLQVWDPTWFRPGVSPAEKLRQQLASKGGERLAVVTRGYLEFLRRGGEVSMAELSPALISRPLRQGRPVVAGLSATYLYQEPREFGDAPDDVRGRPQGHFVVVRGYDRVRREVLVADPLHPNPPFGRRLYRVSLWRLVGAILLGNLTEDANVLIIEPPGPGPGRGRGPEGAGRKRRAHARGA